MDSYNCSQVFSLKCNNGAIVLLTPSNPLTTVLCQIAAYQAQFPLRPYLKGLLQSVLWVPNCHHTTIISIPKYWPQMPVLQIVRDPLGPKEHRKNHASVTVMSHYNLTTILRTIHFFYRKCPYYQL